jgi:hypothetical protein
VIVSKRTPARRIFAIVLDTGDGVWEGSPMAGTSKQTTETKGAVRTGRDVVHYITAMERMLSKHAAKRARVIGLPR